MTVYACEQATSGLVGLGTGDQCPTEGYYRIDLDSNPGHPGYKPTAIPQSHRASTALPFKHIPFFPTDRAELQITSYMVSY